MTPFRDSCWLAGPVLLSYVTHLYCSYVAWKELFPFRQFLGSFSSGVPMQPIPNEDFYSPNTHYQLCLEKGPESCPTACTSPPPPPIACWGSRGMQAPVAPPPLPGITGTSHHPYTRVCTRGASQPCPSGYVGETKEDGRALWQAALPALQTSHHIRPLTLLYLLCTTPGSLNSSIDKLLGKFSLPRDKHQHQAADKH